MKEILKVIRTGTLVSYQDAGRPGGKKFGIPSGGSMDRTAASAANHLVGNPSSATVVELCLHGAAFEVLQDSWLSVAGAAQESDPTADTARLCRAGEILTWKAPRHGVWSYLAVPGGWQAPVFWGSTSTSSRGEFGRPLRPGDVLCSPGSGEALSPRIERRTLSTELRRNLARPPVFRLWPGPQRSLFPRETLEKLFAGPWRVSARSNRIGYRLERDQPMDMPTLSLPSEPVVTGSIQLPPGGQPLVILRDGPTVGGYPKPALLDPSQIDDFVQCPPGSLIRFAPAMGHPASFFSGESFFDK
jgi:biotin-dependent carboxylase-like uncharacterized protein